MAEQAYAYVTLIPVAKGFQSAISKELNGVGGTGGSAGKAAGGSFKSGFGGALKGLAAIAGTAIAAAGVGSFFKTSVSQASDLEESINAVSVAYGTAGESIVKLGKDASTRLGVTSSDFNAAAVRFSAFAERVVGTGGDVSTFVDGITTRAADFASVFNIDVAEALQVFQSGLAGEAEPLKRFGINLLDSEVSAYALANGIGEVGRTLTESEKVQARYGLLLQSTAKTQGDFANTSDGLANSQRILKASFSEMQAEVGNALLPVLASLVNQVKDELLPLFERLGDWLKSPDGTQAIADLGQAFSDGIEFIVEFTGFLQENWEAVKNIGEMVVIAAIALGTYTAASKLAIAAQLLFNAAVLANPFVLAAAALVALVGAAIAFRTETDNGIKSIETSTTQITVLEGEMERLSTAYSNGAIDLETYERQAAALRREIDKLTTSTQQSAGELNRFQALRDISDLKKGNTAWANSWTARGEYAKKVIADIPPVVTTSTGPTAAEMREALKGYIKDTKKALKENRKDYNSAIKEANKDYTSAQLDIAERYESAISAATERRNKSLADSLKNYNQRVADINQKSAQALTNIIQQSMDRLRDAFRSAAEVDIADMFSSDAINKNIGGLLEGLRNKLTGSRQLIANASELASQGFSQTFIEQVVSAGAEVGNELAKGILNATPEQQREIRELFNVIETEAATGMDALAQTLYEKNGLATAELKKMYDQVLIDQTESLAEQKRLYDEAIAEIMVAFNQEIADAKETRDSALLDAEDALTEALLKANEAFLDSLNKIDEDFKAKIAGMKGAISGLRSELAKLDSAVSSARATAQTQITGLQNLLPMAEGGLVTGPTRALIGEAGPEMVIPLDRVQSILGNMGGEGKSVNYYAAPNQSIDSEQELFQAMRRAKVVANW